MPILPPTWTSCPAALQQMRGERGGGRFAVGAGDGDERRLRRVGAALTAEQLDVADHLDRGGARQPHRPMRRRMGQRHPGGEHQRGDPRPVDLPQVGGGNAGGGRLGDGVGAVVPADHVGAAGQERARAREPGAAEAEHGDLPAGETGDGNHGYSPTLCARRPLPTLAGAIACGRKRRDFVLRPHPEGAHAALPPQYRSRVRASRRMRGGSVSCGHASRRIAAGAAMLLSMRAVNSCVTAHVAIPAAPHPSPASGRGTDPYRRSALANKKVTSISASTAPPAPARPR